MKLSTWLANNKIASAYLAHIGIDRIKVRNYRPFVWHRHDATSKILAMEELENVLDVAQPEELACPAETERVCDVVVYRRPDRVPAWASSDIDLASCKMSRHAALSQRSGVRRTVLLCVKKAVSVYLCVKC